MKKLWFRAKTYGYGWFPITWEGWAVLAVFVVGLFVFVYGSIGWLPKTPTTAQLLYFFIPILVWTGLLVAVCSRTGEKLGWRWGKKN